MTIKDLKELYYLAIFGKPPVYDAYGDRKLSYSEIRRREHEHERYNMIFRRDNPDEFVRQEEQYYDQKNHPMPLHKQKVEELKSLNEERREFEQHFEAALRNEQLEVRPDDDSYFSHYGFDGGKPLHPVHYRRFRQALAKYNSGVQLSIQEAA